MEAISFVEISQRIESDIQALFPAYSSRLVTADDGRVGVHDYVDGRPLFPGSTEDDTQNLNNSIENTNITLLETSKSDQGGNNEAYGAELVGEEGAGTMRVEINRSEVLAEIRNIEDMLLQRIAYLRSRD